MVTGLVGKYVFYSDEDYWKSGKIIEDIGHGFFLIEWDKTVSPSNMTTIHSVVQMATQGDWSFFESREELTKYTTWLEEPADKGNKVVSLVKSK